MYRIIIIKTLIVNLKVNIFKIIKQLFRKQCFHLAVFKEYFRKRVSHVRGLSYLA